jgi:hypothetical protein
LHVDGLSPDEWMMEKSADRHMEYKGEL